ncbi:MAG TPA: beta-ketoacyl synthase N-terminal-like domain-containing protein [Longimicrobium sp.]|nr:beta-ketoacyl synthase N-terminal-like domain-containing protein [Longimicrobium sp.]
MSTPDPRQQEFPPDAVAVIGMAGRFPGSPDVDAFWRNLRNAKEGITFFTDDELRAEGVSEELLARPNYVRARGVVEGTDLFDASFFNYRARDAELMDPQLRFFLEACWEAMESAGYDPVEYPGSVGVYAGQSWPSYFFHHYVRDRSLFEGDSAWQVGMLTRNDFLTTHVSYRLRLRGPSMNIQTACSTSLVTVHVAVQALLNGECDMAMAGGVSIGVPSRRGYVYDEGHIMSPDGHCRAFDAQASGTVDGEGVGVVVLKRLDRALEDGDNVLAVVLATAVNNDGEYKAGYTAPGVSGQAEVITEAQAVAGVTPESITYVEAHGTGTQLGDPIEITALKEAFGTAGGEGWCAVGAVKSNVGHLDAAAGITGFIKTVQALRHRQIPPTLHFRSPNPKLGIEGSPFFVADRLMDWTVPGGGPRRAGVSSFGIGGTNAHAVLQEAPPREASPPGRPWSLLILSGRTARAMDRATRNLADWLEAHPDANLADVAYTLQVGRHPYRHRRSLVARDVADALQQLRTLNPARVRTDVDPYRPTPVIYLLPGAGVQHVGMTRELYADEAVFRDQLDRCCELLRPHLGLDLRDVIFPAEGQEERAAETLFQTAITQPALFAVEYAMAQLWMHCDVRPEGMVGYSIGEYTAACLAGVMSLEDACHLVAVRAALMQEMPAGGMLSVSLSEAEVREILPAELDVCTLNGPELTVVGGDAEAVDAFAAELDRREVHYQRVHTSHVSHSRMMDPILARFEEVVRGFTLRPPELPFVSNVTGTWITDAEATDPAYWVRHLRGTVRFDDCLRTLMEEPDRVLLEVGPGRGLTTLARRHPARDPGMVAVNSLPHVRDEMGEAQQFWATVADLWHVGIEPEWPRFYDGVRRLRLRLPTYPWDHGRYWLGVRDAQTQEEHEYIPAHPFELPEFVPPRNSYEAGVVEIFQDLFGIEDVGIYHNFFHMGGDSLLGVQLVKRIRDRWGAQIPLRVLWEIRTVSDVAQLVARAVDPDGDHDAEPAPAELAGAPA